MDEKRGLSDVVTTLIMILLVLVAVGIVWVVVKNIIDKSVNDISTDSFNVGLEIKNAWIESELTKMTVARLPGEADLEGLKFSIEFIDGNTESCKTIFSNVSMTFNELDIKTFNCTHTLDEDGIASIGVAPIFINSEGEEVIEVITETWNSGESTGTITPPVCTPSCAGKVCGNDGCGGSCGGACPALTTCSGAGQCVLETTNLAAWWKFDGDATDSSANNNDGTVNGATLIAGHSGQAYSFDGIDDYITVADSNPPDPELNDFSVSMWIWISSTQSNELPAPFHKGGWYGEAETGYNSYIDGDYFAFRTKYSLDNSVFQSTYVAGVNKDQWVHIVMTVDRDGYQTIYEGNNLVIQEDISTRSGISLSNSNPFIFGSTSTFTYPLTGSIDEVMIFNKALTLDEIDTLFSGSYS